MKSLFSEYKGLGYTSSLQLGEVNDAELSNYLATKVFREIESKVCHAWRSRIYQANDTLKVSSTGIINREYLELYCTSILNISPDNISYKHTSEGGNYKIVLSEDAVSRIPRLPSYRQGYLEKVVQQFNAESSINGK